MIYAKSFFGAAAYSLYLSKELATSDYWDKERKIEGHWVGTGCPALGVQGIVTDQQFESLQANKHPTTADKITPRTKTTRKEWVVELSRHGKQTLVKRNVPNRRAFYDITTSAPKAFSVLAITGGADVVTEWHIKASEKAFKELETFTSRKDCKGEGTRTEVTGNLAGATYLHDSNRLLEPQLHTHHVVMNMTKAPDEHWYAIESRAWMDRMRYFTEIYWHELSVQAAQAGLEIYRDKSGAPQIKGLEDILPLYSLRSQELEHLVTHAEEIAGTKLTKTERKRIVFSSRGIDIPKFERMWAANGSKVLAEYQRSGKTEIARQGLLKAITEMIKACSDGGLTEVRTQDVLDQQRAMMSAEQRERLQALAARTRLPPAPLASANYSQALDYAVKKLFERRSVVKGWEVLSEAINFSHGKAIDISDLKQAALARPDLIFKTGGVTTREHLGREDELLSWVGSGGGAALPPMPAPDLSAHQREAINRLLACPDQFMALCGKAGAGKTRGSKRLIDHNVSLGYRAVAVAPSTKARDRSYEGPLKENISKHTLQMFLQSEKVRSELRKGDLLVIDEAGFASVEQLHKAFGYAKEGGWRVLLIGDSRQNVSVEAGDAFRILLDRTKMHREWLSKIERQKPEALNGRYLRACKFFSVGRSTEAFATLDRAGAVEVARGPDRIDKMAKLIMDEQAEGLSVIAVNPSNRENDAVNEAVRRRLKEAGTLGEERLILSHRNMGWALADRELFSRFKPGMVLEITSGKDKGTPWIVTEVEPGRVKACYGGQERWFTKANAKTFEVCEQRPLPVAIGDLIVTNAGMKRDGKEVANGTRLKVVGFSEASEPIAEDGTVISTRNLSHGYASTSCKCQSETCDSVVFGMDRHSVQWATQKVAYVGATRGRTRIKIFCESRADLIQIEQRPGDRMSAVELVRPHGHAIKREREPQMAITS